MQEKIDNLKQLLNQHEAKDTFSDYCSETDTEGGCTSDNMLDPEDRNDHVGNKYSGEPDDDVTIASLVHKSKGSSQIKAPKMQSASKKVDELCDVAEDTKTVLSRSCTNHSVGRKRIRVVLSDDESEESPEIVQLKKASTSLANSISGTGFISII